LGCGRHLLPDSGPAEASSYAAIAPRTPGPVPGVPESLLLPSQSLAHPKDLLAPWRQGDVRASGEPLALSQRPLCCALLHPAAGRCGQGVGPGDKSAHDLTLVIGHALGGLPGERLMRRLNLATSDDTVLRLLKLLPREPVPSDIPGGSASMSGPGVRAKLRNDSGGFGTGSVTQSFPQS
jgi:hypothetical protein